MMAGMMVSLKAWMMVVEMAAMTAVWRAEMMDSLVGMTAVQTVAMSAATTV